MLVVLVVMLLGAQITLSQEGLLVYNTNVKRVGNLLKHQVVFVICMVVLLLVVVLLL